MKAVFGIRKRAAFDDGSDGDGVDGRFNAGLIGRPRERFEPIDTGNRRNGDSRCRRRRQIDRVDHRAAGQ
jgi:hypothetical protein